jgi:hypothetical protein
MIESYLRLLYLDASTQSASTQAEFASDDARWYSRLSGVAKVQLIDRASKQIREIWQRGERIA